MALKTVWDQKVQKGNSGFGVLGKRGDGIYPPEILQLILQEERARSNRSRSEFSFILFDLSIVRDNNMLLSGFASALSDRVRSIDKVGWMSEYTVGVVLPATSPAGAQTLADEVLRSQRMEDMNISYTIYTYPYDTFAV